MPRGLDALLWRRRAGWATTTWRSRTTGSTSRNERVPWRTRQRASRTSSTQSTASLCCTGPPASGPTSRLPGTWRTAYCRSARRITATTPSPPDGGFWTSPRRRATTVTSRKWDRTGNWFAPPLRSFRGGSSNASRIPGATRAAAPLTGCGSTSSCGSAPPEPAPLLHRAASVPRPPGGGAVLLHARLPWRKNAFLKSHLQSIGNPLNASWRSRTLSP